MRTTLLSGGTVVSTEGRLAADVLIEGRRIVAVQAPGTPVAADVEVIDVSGKLLLPGGVDTHTHLEHRVASGATRTADDFFSGTIAAACGGTTTIVDFVRAPAGQPIDEAFHARRAAAAAACVIDFGFHPIVPASAGDDDTFDRLTRLTREEGTASWKFFMAYPGSMVSDDVLIRGFRAARDCGALPMVHAENGHMIADAVERLMDAGRTAEHEHLHAHPADAEVEAVQRAITLAEHVETPLFIVHVSAAEAARVVRARRDAGADVRAETCPQYLVTSYEDYSDAGARAAGYICSPPIREDANRAELWTAVSNGTVDTIGTDHAAFALHTTDPTMPQKDVGGGVFSAIPNGVPGVEERLMVMYTAGVGTGRISLERFVELTATAPAQTFGLFPRKGAIVAGADADIVVWDPDAERTLSARTHHSLADYSVYEGMTVRGVPAAVYSRGELVAVDGEPTEAATRGRGTYLARQTRSH